MLPKGKRRRTVRPEYVATRGVEPELDAAIPLMDLGLGAPGEIRRFVAPAEARGKRLDFYLAQAIPDISRARVQLLIEHGQVRFGGARAKPKHTVSPGEVIEIEGSPRPEPLKATPEAIPLNLVFEDDHLAVINKPAGMMVHAGNAPASEPGANPDPNPDPDADPEATEPGNAATDPRSSGTLVNALLHHFTGQLSSVGGELRPGIVHRLDKQTSGLILVAKDDLTHRRLGDMFAAREVHKTYLALVHGHLRLPDTTVKLPIGRDLLRRTRMTTRRPPDAPGVRSAVSHVHVLERLQTDFGPFTLVEVTIETGRTHQIRVHLQALGHPVVGDTLYGAPGSIRHTPTPGTAASIAEPLSLPRNFLHAARLALTHPRTGKPIDLEAPLPPELVAFLEILRSTAAVTTTPPDRPRAAKPTAARLR